MKEQTSKSLEDRVILEAKLFLKDGATIRSVAQEVEMSKSTIAYDLRNRLQQVGRPDLFKEVSAKLNYNRADAPLRGAKVSHDKFTERQQNERE